MIPRSALISSAGFGRIGKGFRGCGEKNRACGGGSDEKAEPVRTFPVHLWSSFVQTHPQALLFSPCPPNPLHIPADPAGVLPSQPFALLPPHSIPSAGCPTVRSGLSPSTQHIPLPSEPTIANCQLICSRPTPPHAFRAYNCPPDPLLPAYTL